MGGDVQWKSVRVGGATVYTKSSRRPVTSCRLIYSTRTRLCESFTEVLKLFTDRVNSADMKHYLSSSVCLCVCET